MRKHYRWIITVLCYALFFGICLIILDLIRSMRSGSWQIDFLSHFVLPFMLYFADRTSKLLIRRCGLSLEQERVEVVQKPKALASNKRIAATLERQLIAIDEDKKPMTQRERIQYYAVVVSLFLGMGYLTIVQLFDDIQQRRVSSDLQMYAPCFLLSALAIWWLITYEKKIILAKFDETFSILSIRLSFWSTVHIAWKQVHSLQVSTKMDDYGTHTKRSLKFYNHRNELLKEIEPSLLDDQNYEAIIRFVQEHLQQSNEYSTNAFDSTTLR